MKKILDLFGLCLKKDVVELINIGVNGTKKRDAYSIGMCNGMLWVKSVITGKEPVYFEKVGRKSGK